MPIDPKRPDGASRIQHVQPGFGGGGPTAQPAPPASPTPPTPPTPQKLPRDPDAEPLPVVEGLGPATARTITAFGKEQRHEATWNRAPNTTGQGAIHVRTFHSKLTDDALTYMDQLINEWLDAHPQYEVKFVNSTVGVLTGKLKEPHLICQVWV